MKLPTKYEDLTVNQFMQLEALKHSELDKIDSAVKRLSILSGKSIDELESETPDYIYTELKHCIFLAYEIHEMPLKSEIKIGSKVFKAITEITEITTAQHKDFNTILNNNGNDYKKCFDAILCIMHKEKTKNGFEYLSVNHLENIELFRQAKLVDTIGAVFFYSKCLKNSNEILVNCLQEKKAMITELMTEITNDVEFQSSLNNGVGSIA